MRDSLTIDIAKCDIVEREEFGTTTDGGGHVLAAPHGKKESPQDEVGCVLVTRG